MNYLLKTESSAYSFADLKREQTTIWDGITNPVALKNLRGMNSGDRLVIYHTGDEKRAVGTATVAAVETEDPKNPRIRIKAGKEISQPLSLADIKQNKKFADSPLVRQARLSVVPLSDEQYQILVGG